LPAEEKISFAVRVSRILIWLRGANTGLNVLLNSPVVVLLKISIILQGPKLALEATPDYIIVWNATKIKA